METNVQQFVERSVIDPLRVPHGIPSITVAVTIAFDTIFGWDVAFSQDTGKRTVQSVRGSRILVPGFWVWLPIATETHTRCCDAGSVNEIANAPASVLLHDGLEGLEILVSVVLGLTGLCAPQSQDSIEKVEAVGDEAL